ncbi:MAG: tyrosine-type recombinase/integrase [Candidatus Xenobia bacterium]
MALPKLKATDIPGVLVHEIDKKHRIYYIRYDDQYGKRHVEKVGTKSAARDALAQRRAEVRQGKFRSGDASRRAKPLFESRMREYLDGPAKRLLDYTHARIYGHRWIAYFRGRPMDAITSSDIERWVGAQIEAGLKPASINKALVYLRRVYSIAVRDGVVEHSPCRWVRRLVENNERVRWLTEEEQARVIAVLPPRFHHYVIIAIGTGLRWSEMLGMRWDRVDMVNRVITVPRSKHGRARHVMVHKDVLEVLQSLQSRMRSPWVFPHRADPSKPLRRAGHLAKAWRKAIDQAGLTDVRWHDLRHTFASRLVMAGVSLPIVKELMGHKTWAMTLRYAHLAPQLLVEALDKIPVFVPGVEIAPVEEDDSRSPVPIERRRKWEAKRVVASPRVQLRQARKAKGLTQPQLAALLDPPVSVQTIYYWEAGERRPSAEHQTQLDRLLGTHLASVTPGVTSGQP